MSLVPRCSRVLAVTLAVCAAAALVGCGSTDGGAGASGELMRPRIDSVEPGEPVSGDVSVTWKNLDPRYPDVTQILVNASSRAGRELRSGRITSSEVRVVPDDVMGTVLGELEDAEYFEHATPGMNLDTLPDTAGRRGVVIVTNNGRVWGLMLSTGLGRESPIPRTYMTSKNLVLAIHGAVQGLEVRTNVDEDDVFSAPPPRPLQRR